MMSIDPREKEKLRLSDEGFSDDEAESILARAAKLQGELDAADDLHDKEDLEASAAEVGIRPELIDQAIRELQEDRKRDERERREASQKRSTTLKISGAVAVVLVVLCSWMGISTHSALSESLAAVEAQRAELDNMLLRRHDLIPNLIALTRSAAARDDAVVASLKALADRAGTETDPEARDRTEAALGTAMQSVLSGLGSDPVLGSSKVYVRMSDELAGTENRIAVARRRYNEAVVAYNEAARSFPRALFRPLTGMPASISTTPVTAGTATVPGLDG